MRDEPTSADVEAMIAGLRINGMTPTQIARESGVSRQTVWRLSVGETSRPSYTVVHRIERVYLSRVSKP